MGRRSAWHAREVDHKVRTSRALAMEDGSYRLGVVFEFVKGNRTIRTTLSLLGQIVFGSMDCWVEREE